MREEWRGFKEGVWEREINTRDFIQKNFTPYEGDESFLAERPKSMPRLRSLCIVA